MHENTPDHALHGIQCWCGNRVLETFSTAYRYCALCGTLISQQWPEHDVTHVADDTHDFYGKSYWFAHQESDLGFPNIADRARTDLPERCLHWLRTLLKYKLPPARVLELGSAHGGFVALLHWAGFEATGLEMSPWVVNFARQTFEIPMLQGPIEEQQMAPGTLDAIALMDVLEHLPDPVDTMHHCLRLLKPDGLLLIQTPCLPAGQTYAEMTAQGHNFLEQLKAKEHLYLFSQRSIREFFCRLEAPYLEFEPAIFAHYDMFLVVSRSPLVMHAPEALRRALSATARGRVVQALLDSNDQHRDLQQRYDDLQQRYTASEADRVARLAVIEQQGRDIAQVQTQVHQWLQEHHDLHNQSLGVMARQEEEIAQLQRQRQYWLQESQSLTTRVQELTGTRDRLLAEQTALQQDLEAVKGDRAAWLTIIKRQGDGMAQLHTQMQQQRQESQYWHEQYEMRQHVIKTIAHTRAYRLLRRLRRWTFMEQAVSIPCVDAPPHSQQQRHVLPNSLTSYTETISMSHAAQPNRELLERMRSFNHYMIDELHAIRPLQGRFILDIGASPCGYTLERALEHDAALYVGIGLGITERQCIQGEHGNTGVLLNMDATSLPFPADMFDVAVSISTFEHFTAIDAVLYELERVLKVGGVALISFDGVWSCSYGHYLLHFGECANLVPPWAHLIWTSEQMRQALAATWPEHAPLSLEQAIEWIYTSPDLNRLTIRQIRAFLDHCSLDVNWTVELKDDEVDHAALQNAMRVTGLSADELTTRGLSVLLAKTGNSGPAQQTEAESTRAVLHHTAAITDLSTVAHVASQPPTKTEQSLEFAACYAQVREPKHPEGVAYAPGAEDRIVQRLRSLGHTRERLCHRRRGLPTVCCDRAVCGRFSTLLSDQPPREVARTLLSSQAAAAQCPGCLYRYCQ